MEKNIEKKAKQLIGSVKIIHDELCGGAYRFLADYFRAVGSYVSECTMKNSQVDKDYDLVIIIEDNIDKMNLENFQRNYENAIQLKAINLITAGQKARKTYLENILNILGQRTVTDNQMKLDKEIEHLKFIAKVYVDEELMKARATFAYLNNEKELVQDAQQRYVKAYAKIVKHIQEGGTSRYLDYARIQFAKHINETCIFLNQVLMFEPSKLIRFLEHAIFKYDNFSNLYVEQGFLAEMDVRYRKETIDFYKAALNEIKDKAYASYVYYRLGRIYEQQEKDWETAIRYYQDAIQAKPDEYRAIYKMGIYERQNYHFDSAIRYFSKILEIFSIKQENNYLQEFEYEYLFKAYYALALIYEDLNKFEKAGEHYFNLINIHQLTEQKNDLYDEIYGVDASAEMRKCTKQRLLIGRAYQRLSSLYSKMDKEQEVLHAQILYKRQGRNVESDGERN